MGNFPCYKHNESSLIDYAIASEDMLPEIEPFCVSPLNELSDHSLIWFTFKSNYSNYNNQNKAYTKTYRNIIRKFKWNMYCLENYQQALVSPESASHIRFNAKQLLLRTSK